MSARVIVTWLYNNTGKGVFVAAVFHIMMNVTWQFFPVSGSYYDPRIGGLITAAVAVVVILVWGRARCVVHNLEHYRAPLLRMCAGSQVSVGARASLPPLGKSGDYEEA